MRYQPFGGRACLRVSELAGGYGQPTNAGAIRLGAPRDDVIAALGSGVDRDRDPLTPPAAA